MDPISTNLTMKAYIAKNVDTAGNIAIRSGVGSNGFSYFGGKGGFYQRLINLMPPHNVYIETHLGGGAVMRNKRPARINIGIDVDPAVHEMWNAGKYCHVRFLQIDAVTFLNSFKTDRSTLIYCDPPYLLSTRKCGKRYRFEYSEAAHIELLNVLKNRNSDMVIISGYWSELYEDMLSDWNTISFRVATRQGMATEWVWFNFDKPNELHDYQYLGDTFRDRERITRKQNRWIKNLEKMPIIERHAMLQKISDRFLQGSPHRQLQR